jgi:superfamily II DNA/RNA helicase
VHRAGRCGLAGATGIAISICTSNEAFVVRKFACELSLEIPLVEMRGGSISVK